MVQFFSKRRLKIAEQIIIVIFFAVIIPMTVCGFIINNINQQSNRSQLREAAIMIADIVSEEVDVFKKSIDNELSQIAATLEYYNSPSKNGLYLNSIKKNMSFYKELKIIRPQELKKFGEYELEEGYVVYNKPLKDGNILVAVLDIKNIKENLFKTVSEGKRQVYILAGDENKLIASVNYEENVFNSSIEQLPRKLKQDKTVIYGKVKNQPLAYHKKTDPNLTIIVNTTEDITKHLIDYSRNKILLSILFTVLAVFLVVGLYTSYLYTNIRQLFKAIIAISRSVVGRLSPKRMWTSSTNACRK